MRLRPGFGKSVTPAFGSLEDPWARLKRANHYLEMLETDHGISTHLSHYRVRPEMHRDGLEYRFYLAEAVPEIDPDVPFLVSEMLFNLRSALDQLAYQLHVRRYRGNVPRDAERHAMFPILDAAEVSRRGRRSHETCTWNEIKRLSKRDRTAIQQFQPYITRDDRLQRTREMLNLLSILHNIDKHRRLHIIRALPAAVSKSQDFPAWCGFRQTVFHCALVPDAEVERWTFERPPSDMKVDHYCWPQIVLDESSLNLRVYLNSFLQAVYGHVDSVVQRFNTRFGYEPWRRWNSLGTDWRAPRPAHGAPSMS